MANNTFDMFEGLPDYAVMYLQEQCRLYLTVPGVKEYLERTYKGFLDAGFTVEEAQRGIKHIVETKTLAFIGEMNRVQEEARKENKGIRRIRNKLRRWIERTWKRIILEFHIHFF